MADIGGTTEAHVAGRNTSHQPMAPRNISEQGSADDDVHAQSELLDAASEAVVTNQDISDLLSRLSHDLRTPLNAVLGYAQLLEDSELADPNDRRSVAEILRAGGRLLDLIIEELDVTRVADASRRSGDELDIGQLLTLVDRLDPPARPRVSA